MKLWQKGEREDGGKVQKGVFEDLGPLHQGGGGGEAGGGGNGRRCASPTFGDSAVRRIGKGANGGRRGRAVHAGKKGRDTESHFAYASIRGDKKKG